VASDQSVGTKGEKSEECQAHYQQFKDVKEGVDTLAHGGSPFPSLADSKIDTFSNTISTLVSVL
jgi:hypothetical protein